MCELLVFVHDHTAAKPAQRVVPGSAQHAALPKPGDVITAQEDGWQWGTLEVDHLWFRIVKFPGIPVREAEHLLSPLPAEIDHNLSAVTHAQYRGFSLDLTAPALGATVARPRLPIGF